MAHSTHVSPGLQGGLPEPQRWAQNPPSNTQTSSPMLLPQSTCSSHGVKPVDELTVTVVAVVTEAALVDDVVWGVPEPPAPPPPSFSTTTVPEHAESAEAPSKAMSEAKRMP